MIDEVSYLVIRIGIISAVLPLLMLLYVLKEAHRPSWWVLFFVVIVWFLAEALNWIFSVYGINNLIIFHLYELLSVVTYAWLYYSIVDYKWFKKSAIIAVVLFEIVAISYLSVNQLWFEANKLVTFLSILIPMAFSLYYFAYTIGRATVRKLSDSPYYWVNCAVLINFGMVFFTRMFESTIIQSEELMTYLWPIVSLSNIIYNVLFSRGVWSLKRT
ncbi:MAG: hypothetical protein ACJA1C_002240 [Crocinitomicaceae bacterium]|jgi:hypothetical protein